VELVLLFEKEFEQETIINKRNSFTTDENPALRVTSETVLRKERIYSECQYLWHAHSTYISRHTPHHKQKHFLFDLSQYILYYKRAHKKKHAQFNLFEFSTLHPQVHFAKKT